MKAFLRRFIKIIRYLLSPRDHCNNIQVCGWDATFLPRFVTDMNNMNEKKHES